MAGQELVPARNVLDLTSTEGLPDIVLAQQRVSELIDAGEAEVIDEVRLRAEARGLYERRRDDAKAERHFAKLRLLAEAALGVLSWDMPDVVPSVGGRGAWRALAAGYERGKLLWACDEIARTQGDAIGSLSTTKVSALLRLYGWTRVPGSALDNDPLNRIESLAWVDARRIALDRGVSLVDLPPDLNYARNRARQNEEASQRMRQAYAAAAREDRRGQAKRISAAAKQTGPAMTEAYGHLRRALGAFQEARATLDGPSRRRLDDVFTYLHAAEDELGSLLL